jgi:formylglycine-generating enzyme required for sulfatase activity
MRASMTPQEAIAAGLPRPSECDVVIVVLWSRMGTPLPPGWRKPDGSAYRSGTEWEFLEAVEATRSAGNDPAPRARPPKPEILVYRRTERFLLDDDDPEFDEKRRQRASVKEFFAEFRSPDGAIRRGVNEYAAPEDFRRALTHDLRAVIAPLLEVSADVAGQDQAVAGTATPGASGAREDRTATTGRGTVEELGGPAGPPLWEGSPFPGLRAFTPDDVPIFFGRGRETDELVRALSNASTRFLMVVGASGSGKSSLVAAGLIPRLAASAIEGAGDWLLPRMVGTGVPGEARQWAGLRFTPGELGDNPFLPLAIRLAPLLAEQAAPVTRLAERLEGDPGEIAPLAQAALAAHPQWAEALLFIDQFEELFAAAVGERRRAAFVDMLSAAVKTPRVRIVATLRADFYHRCVEQPALAEILRAASYPLAAPGPAALLEMIAGPAARAGLDFDDGLPDRILGDTGRDPGALALLAFALDELYRSRTPGGRLTRQAYGDFGGVPGAISRRADATFRRLPAGAQARLGDVFRVLVDVADERGVATRRRARMTTAASSPEAEQLVGAFVGARLLVADRGPDGDAMVEVAHEALLREWPRLAEWIGEKADDLRLRRQAEAAAAEWERSGRAATHLWPHERLVPIHDALARFGVDPAGLREPARTFLRPEAERLLEELEHPGTSHYRRAEIGDRLDRIGDPRPGVGLRADGLPDVVWCEIPAGAILLEGVKGRFEVSSFSIAKYPVTYRQYRVFLDDPAGYRDRRWWEGLDRAPEPGEQYRSIGNCPAEDVSWYDAMAYCRWLGAGLGYQVRLPTEPEWQQAATGGDPENEYPWGAWADVTGNTSESRLGRTTAVGMYPRGASRYGVLDLAGNVWEWCSTDPDRPGEDQRAVEPAPKGSRDRSLVRASRRLLRSSPSEPAHPEVWRVLRGGSWYDARDLARSARRYYGLHPDFRNFNVGIRVVRGSPFLESLITGPLNAGPVLPLARSARPGAEPDAESAEDMSPQAPRVGPAHVVDPGLPAGVKLGEADSPVR